MTYVSSVSFTISRLTKTSGFIPNLPKIFVNNPYIITDNINDNLCWYRFLSICLFDIITQTDENGNAIKSYKPTDRTSKAKKLLLEECGIKYITKIPKEGINILNNYEGTHIEQMKESSFKHKINVDYTYFMKKEMNMNYTTNGEMIHNSKHIQRYYIQKKMLFMLCT